VGPLVLRHGRRQSDRAIGFINPLPPERCNLAAALPGQDQQCNNLGERRCAFECRLQDSAEFVIREDPFSWKTFDRRTAFAWTLIDVAVPNGPLEKYLCGHEGMVLFRGYRLKLLQLLADVVACDLPQVLSAEAKVPMQEPRVIPHRSSPVLLLTRSKKVRNGVVEGRSARPCLSESLLGEQFFGAGASACERDCWKPSDQLPTPASRKNNEGLRAALADPHTEMFLRAVPQRNRAALGRLRGSQH
jgi:hypothetical protein